MASSSRTQGWKVTDDKHSEIDRDYYEEHDDEFSIKLHHGGLFTDMPGRTYMNGIIHYVHYIHRREFNYEMLNNLVMQEKLGYPKYSRKHFYYTKPGSTIDDTLCPLDEDYHFWHFLESVNNRKVISVYAHDGEVNLYRTVPMPDEDDVARIKQMQRQFADRMNKSLNRYDYGLD